MSGFSDLVEVTEERAGNPDAAVKMLREAVSTQSPSPSPAAPAPAEDSLPAKLRGKTREEIAEMYVNLESVNGRMANDLGAQRRLTDQFLELKRREDLTSQQPARPKPSVKVDELLEKPTETLERFSDERERMVEQRLAQRIAAIEGNLARTAFVQKHSDYETVANDPAFIQWVQASQYRSRVANAAYNGDWNAADDLLTEFKGRRQGAAQPQATRQQPAANEAAARAASLESSSAAGAGASASGAGKPIFSRADLMALRLHEPEKYYDDAFQEVVKLAYYEGRVK